MPPNCVFWYSEAFRVFLKFIPSNTYMAGEANDHFVWRLQGFYSQPQLSLPVECVCVCVEGGKVKFSFFTLGALFSRVL